MPDGDFDHRDLTAWVTQSRAQVAEGGRCVGGGGQNEARPEHWTISNPGAETSSDPEGSAGSYGVVLVTVLEVADRASVDRWATTVPHDWVQFLNSTVPRSAEPIQYP